MPSILSTPATPASSPSSGDRPPLATVLVLSLVALKVGVHFLTSALTPYELHRDEFLYLGMGEHLRYWLMDFPPAIAVMARLARAVFGDTLFAVRFFPAVAGALVMWFTALITRELGGRRGAQALAMITVLLGPLFLRPSSLFHPVVFDQLWWTLGFFALVRWQGSGNPRWWLLIGVAGGLGLLTKFSIGFFAVGLSISLVISRQHRIFWTAWPWLAVGIASAIGSASLIGQIRLGFPVLLHMDELQRQQLSHVTYTGFILGQVLMLGPAMLLALGGWFYLARAAAMHSQRTVAWICLVCFLVLLLLHGKAYYLGPIYPTLIAAGAAGLSSLSRGRRLVGGILISMIFGWGMIGLPFGLPMLPPQVMAQYAAKVGMQAAVTTNQGRQLPLPQDYADMLGWRKQVAAVASVWQALPPDQRAQAMLLARNYGEAGALEFHGPEFGLPSRILLPENDLLWAPPPGNACNVVVSIGISESDLRQYFRSVKLVERFDHPWMVPEERGVPICIAESPSRSILDAWPRLRRGP